MKHLTTSLLFPLALIGCSEFDMASAEDAAAPGVAQAGAQDFGFFREILESGGLPGPDTIDDIGFFNEHVIELPDPNCGDSVCIHGRLGMMGNMINGGDCTIIMMGMNTPIDPDALERDPLNLVLAIDTSGSMNGDAMRFVKSGLTMMLEQLEPDDMVTLIDFDTEARVIGQGSGADHDDLFTAIAGMSAGGSTNLFGALDLAYDTVELIRAEAAGAEVVIPRDDRIVLLSDGMATAGITEPEMISGLATAHAGDEILLTTIGVGSDFDFDLMKGMAEDGEGSFYYLEDPAAVEEVFIDEVTSFLVPIARDVSIDVSVVPGWRTRAVYGTRDFTFSDDRAAISIDTLQIAGRTSAEDNAGGRRGGNGAIIVELVPEDSPESGGVGTIDFAFTDTMADAQASDLVDISTPFDPEKMQDGGQWFEDDQVEKAFVMLNIYAGFEMAANNVEQGDLEQALSTLVSLCQSVQAWVADNPDPDIEDDLRYIDLFIENLRMAGAGQPDAPADPWPND
ncbi:MAG: VWA domain-containing protein [Myxococcota bacterium]